MIFYPVGRSGQIVTFDHNVLEHFYSVRQITRSSQEAGGQLFGRILRREVRIEVATGPRSTDHRTRYSYRADRSAEQKEIDDMFVKGLHFVGDWHTHPEHVPHPSCIDTSNIKECFRKSHHNLNAFLLIIVGTATYPAGLYVGAANFNEVIELMPETRDL